MIAVIADDLTGAAEIGGIGLKYGFRVEIATKVNPESTADLLIINTDSRSKSEADAVSAVTKASEEIKNLNPELVFKKIDSVLRGHILAELEAEMKVLGLSQALIIPANPHLGRIVVNQLYLINGVPVHQTPFAADPEFPISDSYISQMLRVQNQNIAVKKHHEAISDLQIIVGEVETTDDLTAWATLTKAEHFLAGSSSFFAALLSALLYTPAQASFDYIPGKPVLYVSGTTFEANTDKISEVHTAGGPVSYMPQNIVSNQEEYGLEIYNWACDISALIIKYGRAIIAINQYNNVNACKPNAVILRQKMALVVEAVFKQVQFQEMVIEGGSTAAAILDRLSIRSLFPAQELAPGIIRSIAMYHQNIHVTLKPGSYPWSEKIWTF
jgi:uncharacterized protein YgbK (DUF1537 family)